MLFEGKDQTNRNSLKKFAFGMSIVFTIVLIGCGNNKAEVSTAVPTGESTQSIADTIVSTGLYTYLNKTAKQQRKAVVAKAKSQLGYVEIYYNDNKYAKYFINRTRFGSKYIGRVRNHIPWCATFITWCARNAKVSEKLIPTYFKVPDFVSYYRAKGRLRRSDSYIPKYGDLIIFWHKTFWHIGFVRGYKDGNVYTVEGNTTPSWSNLGRVMQKSVNNSNDSIYGYCDNLGKVVAPS